MSWKLGENSPTTVQSAGTYALPGASMPHEAVQLLAERGVQITNDHRAREINPEMIAKADLVLTMTLGHRQEVIEMQPSALRKTFTLREFARVLTVMTEEDADSASTAPPMNFTELVNSVSSYRGIVGSNPIEKNDEVIDPYKSSLKVWQQSLNQMVPAIDVLSAEIKAMYKQ